MGLIIGISFATTPKGLGYESYLKEDTPPEGGDTLRYKTFLQQRIPLRQATSAT